MKRSVVGVAVLNLHLPCLGSFRITGSCLTLALLCFLPTWAPAGPSENFTATLVKVLDGDSFVIRSSQGKVEVRLRGVDCPERDQPHGAEARRFTRAFLKGHRMEVEGLGWDDYGRFLARIRVDGRDLALELVRAGLAWHYTRYSSDPDLAAAEREAQRARRGLWADPRPVPPWKWRRTHSRPSHG